MKSGKGWYGVESKSFRASVEVVKERVEGIVLACSIEAKWFTLVFSDGRGFLGGWVVFPNRLHSLGWFPLLLASKLSPKVLAIESSEVAYSNVQSFAEVLRKPHFEVGDVVWIELGEKEIYNKISAKFNYMAMEHDAEKSFIHVESSEGSNPNSSNPVTKVRMLLFRRMLVGVSDGRFFLGSFHCMDKQGNIILQDTVEYRSTRRSSPSPMEQRCLGLILIPFSCRTSCHVDCSIEEQLSLLSLPG
ncbi:hypothetical protein CK203_003728 [Vitis vinifera]|uniref:Sm domain-containing protein n=2 Tax=Vitis TaxID=3603 RepID=A0A438K868_VITVI|nr:hypothetical protein CK203_003728 [Vitis vinifera]